MIIDINLTYFLFELCDKIDKQTAFTIYQVSSITSRGCINSYWFTFTWAQAILKLNHNLEN